MRLIDADALIDTLDCSDRDLWTKYTIDEAPTIDAVPVVRCGKCVFRYCTGRCAKSGLYMDDDGFCSFGREDGDGNG